MRKFIGIILPLTGIILMFWGIICLGVETDTNIYSPIIYFISGIISLSAGEFVNCHKPTNISGKIRSYRKTTFHVFRALTSLDKASLALTLALILYISVSSELSSSAFWDVTTVLRMATTVILACWCFTSYKQKNYYYVAIFGGITLLYQPFIEPITMEEKLSWKIVDLFLVLFLYLIVFKNYRQSIKNKQQLKPN